MKVEHFSIKLKTWEVDYNNNLETPGSIRKTEYNLKCLNQRYYFLKIDNNYGVFHELDANNILQNNPKSLTIFILIIEKYSIQLIPSVNLQNHSSDNIPLLLVLKSKMHNAILEKGSIINLGYTQLQVKDIVMESKKDSQFISTIIEKENINADEIMKQIENDQIPEDQICPIISQSLKKSKEIKESDKDKKICRICLSEDSKEIEDFLISPCRCKGTLEYVHLSCIRSWIKQSLEIEDNKQQFYFHPLYCELCKSVIDMRILLLDVKEPIAPYIILESFKDNPGYHIISLAERKKIYLGRASNSDVKFRDISVSRYHSCIEFDGNSVKLEDYKSKFGTIINIPKPFFFNIPSSFDLQFGSMYFSFNVKSDGIFSPLKPIYKNDITTHIPKNNIFRRSKMFTPYIYIQSQ